VRQGALRFALPITTGTKPGVADYLPSPHGLPGFSAPVEQTSPALTPYIELDDGRVIVATDGADAIEPSGNGQMLRVGWNRWAVVGTRPGELIDVGLSSEVVWRIENETLIREETLTAKKPLIIRRWRLVVPTNYAAVGTEMNKGTRIDRFRSNAGSLEVQMRNATFPISTWLTATGDSPLGRGVHGAIPLHLVFESENLALHVAQSLKYQLAVTVHVANMRNNN
jgi:hypothetical protein